jgi:prevent-host-death family protein
MNEAQSRLGELMDRAESGEEIVIERAGRVGVKLVPVSVDLTTAARRVGGQNLLGVTYIAPDFDAPMSEEELREWGY